MPRRPEPGTKRPTAWSFSAWKMYYECPLRYKLTRIEKRPTTRGPALIRGDVIHQEGERYLKAGGRVPKSYALFDREMRELRRRKALSEASWAFDVGWREVEWFSPVVWVRVKLDTCYISQDNLDYGPTTAHVIDFKTGRIYEGYGTQLELYAVAAFLKYQDVERVAPAFWFLDRGEIVGGPQETLHLPDVRSYYEREELPQLQRTWQRRAQPMLKDRSFAPASGAHCRWCDFSKAKGGPCRF